MLVITEILQALVSDKWNKVMLPPCHESSLHIIPSSLPFMVDF